MDKPYEKHDLQESPSGLPDPPQPRKTPANPTDMVFIGQD